MDTQTNTEGVSSSGSGGKVLLAWHTIDNDSTTAIAVNK